MWPDWVLWKKKRVKYWNEILHLYVSSSTQDLSALYILHIYFSSFSRWTVSWFITGDFTGGKSPSLNTYVLVSHVDRACVESSWQTMFQWITVAYKYDFICLKMNGRDRCPHASLVLSLPVHPSFFWPGLLLPHVEFANPGGECCLSHQPVPGRIGVVGLF